MEIIQKEVGYNSLSKLNKKLIDYLINNFNGKINKKNETVIPIDLLLKGNSEF